MIDSGLKQRLVGAAVLIALAVLFLPAILDGRKAQYFEDALIPPEPHDAKLDKLAQQLAKNSSQSKLGEPKKHSHPNVTEQGIKNKPAILQTAFIIQVASLGDQNNATKLVNALKKQGFKAFIGREKVKRNGILLSRVLIGPIILRSRADKIMQQIKKNNQIDASVVVFDPRKH